VAITPDAQGVAVLGGIVLIRTFLSFSSNWRSRAGGRGRSATSALTGGPELSATRLNSATHR
jgi:hypothetical protein